MARYSFFCLDGHTCGNPVRLVVGGAPALSGKTMSEKRIDFLKKYDWIRTGLTYEPRGHDLMSGAILYPAFREECDASLLFIETTGSLPMCGHVTIGSVTMGIENGLIKPKKPGKVVLETAAGIIKACYQEKNGRVSSVKFTNAPAFMHAENLTAHLEGIGEFKVDIAYGGNFYAIVEKQQTYHDFHDMSVMDLIQISQQLRTKLNEKYDFIHPQNKTIKGLTHIQWAAPAKQAEAYCSNAVFYGKNAIDRSPCGTGTSARMAQLWSKGRLKKGEKFIHESIIGTLFEGKIEEEINLSNRMPAILASISGWAKQTGVNTIYIDDDDPFSKGFLLHD